MNTVFSFFFFTFFFFGSLFTCTMDGFSSASRFSLQRTKLGCLYSFSSYSCTFPLGLNASGTYSRSYSGFRIATFFVPIYGSSSKKLSLIECFSTRAVSSDFSRNLKATINSCLYFFLASVSGEIGFFLQRLNPSIFLEK